MVMRSSLSDLFKTAIADGAFFARLIINLSSSVSSHELSNTAITSPASAAAFSALSTPIFSTLSSVSRIPAVSQRRKTALPTFTRSSIVSLVVPAISVTMARSYPSIAFKRDDLPTFGLPITALFTPSFSIFPRSYVPSRALRRLSALFSTDSYTPISKSSISSSG